MLYQIENFNEFRDACHTASVDAGWWKTSQRYDWSNDGRNSDPDRLTVPTKLCLIHSEISEAYDGYMTGAMDEHLPEYPNAVVEFGDVLIRIGDLAGYLNINLGSAIMLVLQADHLETYIGNGGYGDSWATIHVAFNRLQYWTSAAMESHRKGNRPDSSIPALSGIAANLARVVILCDMIARKNRWNLPEVCQAKMAFNAIRPDHKLEARAIIDGGKAF